MHEVTLSFYLNEEVTEELFAMKIIQACARGGALREGERVAGGIMLYEYVGDKEISLKELGVGDSDTRFKVPDIKVIHP